MTDIDFGTILEADTMALVEKIIARPMEVWRSPEIRGGFDRRPEEVIYVGHSQGRLVGVLISTVQAINGPEGRLLTHIVWERDGSEFRKWISQMLPGAIGEYFPENASAIS